MFLTERDLAEHGLTDELKEFFRRVNELSHPVTHEFLAHVVHFTANDDPLQQEQANTKKRFDEARKNLGIEELRSLFDITKKSPQDRQRNEFLKEWNKTLQILRDIAQNVVKYKPNWVPEDSPAGAQADAFLHGYYYKHAMEGNRPLYHDLFRQNKERTASALREQLEWWQRLETPPFSEEEMLKVQSPKLRDLLSEKRVLTLSPDDLAEVCVCVHAISEHARQMTYQSLGILKPAQGMKIEDRVRLFGQRLHSRLSRSGQTTLQTIHYVLYGGERTEIPQRLFETCNQPAKKLPDLGLSSLGEIVGWVFPDFSPPRNDRTNKALRALGYNVQVYKK